MLFIERYEQQPMSNTAPTYVAQSQHSSDTVYSEKKKGMKNSAGWQANWQLGKQARNG